VAQDDLGHVPGGVGTGCRAVDDGAGRLELRLERVEERREVVDRARAGRLAGSAEGLDVDALEPADAVVGRTLRDPPALRRRAPRSRSQRLRQDRGEVNDPDAGTHA
jgi:hypothetical protein